MAAGLVTEMAKDDYTAAFEVEAENDALSFSKISGTSATNNRCGHDAKAYTYSGTGYVFRARATDAGALEIQRLTQADILAGTANYGAWTTLLAAGNVAPGRYQGGTKAGGIAVAANDSGDVQVFYFTQPAGGTADLKVGTSAAGGDPGGAWGHATVVSGVDEDALQVAACQINECFYTDRYTAATGEEFDQIKRGVYVVAWSVQSWTLDGRWTLGILGRTTANWGDEAWGGIGCAKHTDNRILIACGALHSKVQPGETHIRGVATFWFSPGTNFGASGAWYEGEWISAAHYSGVCLHWDLWTRVSEVNNELWVIFRHEDEPTDQVQTEGSEVVTRWREVVFARSEDGVHFEEPKRAHGDYRVAGSGPVILLEDVDDHYLYCFTYENVYRSYATSRIGIDNADVQTAIGDYVRPTWAVNVDSRGGGRTADLTVQRNSVLSDDNYQAGYRLTMKAGAVVSGSPSVATVFTGHIRGRDGTNSVDQRLLEMGVSAIAGKSMGDTRSRDRMVRRPQDRVAVEHTSAGQLVPQFGEWHVKLPSWLSGYKLSCGTWPVLESGWLDTSQWAHWLYPYCYISKLPSWNGGIEATVRLAQKSGLFGTGDDHQKSVAVGLLMRGNPLVGDWMFVYENETITQLSYDPWISYGSARMALIKRDFTGYGDDGEAMYDISVVASVAAPGGWTNSAAIHRMKMVCHHKTIYCYYKTAESDAAWTLAFSGYVGVDFGAGYFGLVGRRANRVGGAGAETNKPWWWDVRLYDMEADRTLEWQVRELAAWGGVHEFDFTSELLDEMAVNPSSDDWFTATADGTWVSDGAQWTGSGVAVNRIISKTTLVNLVCDLELEIHASNYAGLVVRAADEDNYIAVILTSTNAALYEMAAGVGSSVQVQPLIVTLPTAAPLIVRISVEGNWYSVWLGKSLLATFYYEYSGSGTYVGLMTLVSGIFERIHIPELTEVPDEAIIEIGQSALEAMRELIRGRWIRWFFDHDGKLRMSYFSSRDDAGTIQEHLTRTMYRERDDYVGTIRIEGAEKRFAEYTYSGIATQRRFDVARMPDLRTVRAMAFWAERMAKTSAELNEQADFEGPPDLRWEPEDEATIVISQDGVNGSYIFENVTLRAWPLRATVGTRQVVI